VKVVLNGQGADEVIGGYSSYFRDYWFTLLLQGRLRETWTEIADYSSHHGGNKTALFVGALGHFARVMLNQAVPYRRLRWKWHRDAARNSWFTNDLAADMEHSFIEPQDWSLNSVLRRSVERGPLPLYLRLEDRNSMAHSVECRLPFMDYRLVSLVFKCAPDWKLHGPWNKYLLREAMRDRIPESVRTRITKWGFPVPQRDWISGAWYELIQALLASSEMRERGIYDLPAVRRDLELHRQGHVDLTGAFFRLVQFELWCRRLKGVTHSAIYAEPAYLQRDRHAWPRTA
jgi:asparagine synthase (glutamine-hydrolysing)